MTALAAPLPLTGRRLWLARFGFFLGAMGAAAGLQIVAVLMLRYLTDSLAISAVVAGGVLALTKVYDAVIDPLIGWASDKTRTPWGRRRPYLMAGTILLPLSVALMFNLPQMASGATVAVIGLLLLVHGTGYSAFVVPYVASVAELTEDYHERSVLMSFRVYGGSVGLMIAATGAPWLLAYWGSDRAAHGYMGLVLSAVLLVGLALAVVFMPEPVHDGSRQPRVPLRRRLAMAWGNKPFRLVVMSHVAFQIGVGAVTVSTAYFSRHVLHLSDVWLGLFYLAKVAGNLVSVPIFLWIAKRIDKKWAYITALVGYGLLNLSWVFAGPGEPVALTFARLFAIGIVMGGALLLSYSILTDVIRYDTIRTGMRQEGAFSGVVAFIDKAFQAAGVAFVGYLLSSMGYLSSMKGAQIQQPDTALTAIYIAFSAIPGTAALVCVLTMLGYGLKESDLIAAPVEAR